MMLTGGDYSVKLFVSVTCIALAFFLILYMPKKEAEKQERLGKRICAQLQKLDFFYTLFVGKSYKEGRMVDGCKVWSDATYTVVIKQNNRAIAVVGFELSSDCMTVHQLQGIKGRKIRRAAFAPFLLRCAEEIARKLRKRVIRIESAHRLMYFVPPDEESELYACMYEHQDRLRVLYNQAPREAGYEEEVWMGQVIRRYKVLRKGLSFRRWLTLQEIRFNRAAQSAQPFLREYAHDA